MQQIRKICAEAIRQCELAEQQAKRTQEAATSLSLSSGSIAPHAPPSAAGLDELARQLQNQRSQARDALSRLKTAAEELEDERRKWWKFW